MNGRPFNLARAERTGDFRTERSLQQFHDAQDADAAAEERGAATALERLTNQACWIGADLAKNNSTEVHLFLVSFIGAVRPISRNLANAMAAASGLNSLVVEA